MNDPNGLVYFEGEYHLFFQYHPHSTIWGPMHWGHAISTDLVHWVELPIALAPDQHGTIFSGSAVVDAENTSGLVPGGGIVAIFSYDNQSQGLAFSTDKGRTWTFYDGNPIIPSPGTDFRDPKVFWHSPVKQWVMAIAAKDRVQFYSSLNLREWVLESETMNEMEGVGVTECPDLFPLTFNGKTYWVLLISVDKGAVAGGSGTFYQIGSFDGKAFTPETIPRWLDYGPDNYAAVTWNNAPDGRRILIGWMNNWQYARLIPTSTWRGALTLPRVLKLSDVGGLHLRQDAIPSLRRLWGTGVHLYYRVISDSLKLSQPGQAAEIILHFELQNAREFGIHLCVSEDQRTTIGYNAADEMLFVNRTHSGLVDFHPIFQGIYTAPLKPNNGRIKLHVFVDNAGIEVFANDGSVVITSQIFPVTSGPELEIYATDGSVHLLALEMYPVRSIWR